MHDSLLMKEGGRVHGWGMKGGGKEGGLVGGRRDEEDRRW